MKTQKFLCIVVAILQLQYQISSCANILFFHGGTYSHRIVVWNLVEKLAELGHNVTFFQPIVPKPEHQHPNVTEFFPEELQLALKKPGSYEERSVFTNRLNMDRNYNQFIASVHILPEKSLNLCSKLLSTSAGLNWVNSSKYDLVIIDGAFNECGLALAHLKFNASKVIYFATSTIFSWHYEPFGLYHDSSWIPDLHVSYQYPLNFYERTVSTFLPLLFYYYKVWIYYPQLEDLLRTKLGLDTVPKIEQLEKKVDLMFVNTHFSEEFARSFPPFVVPIGGIAISELMEDKKKSQKIPNALAKFMDESDENGFILVSFGSAAEISHSPEWLRNVFYTAFKNSETRFVWKWEGTRPKEMPKNVFTSEWLPQREVLRHPKIRAFMTHGGLMSIQEAIINTVPLVVLPIFADQDYNAFRIERLQRGIRLEISTLKTFELEKAIAEILGNPRYKLNMIATRNLFLDRPEKPINTALWWIDYILRHDDTTHLKPLSTNQFWYERRLLDVWAVLITTMVLLLVLIIYILHWIYKLQLKIIYVIFPHKILNSSSC